MNIYVNDQKLDASLNEEKTLRDVYDAVDQWSRNQNHYIMNLLVDNQEVAPSRLDDMELETVERLDFTVADHDHFIVEAAHELDRYLDQVGSFLFQKEYLSESQMKDLMEGYEWIDQAVHSLAGLLNLDLENLVVPLPEGQVSAPIAHTMNALKISLESLASSVEQGKEQTEELETVLLHMRPIKSMSMRLALQLAAQSAGMEELGEALEKFESRLPEFKQEIISINESFQSGREGEALENLDAVIQKFGDAFAEITGMDAKLVTCFRIQSSALDLWSAVARSQSRC